MEPEEVEPGLLVGRQVVEVGIRQAWPFLTIADHQTGREVRLVIDADITVGAGEPMDQDAPGLLRALDQASMQTIAAAYLDGAALVLRTEGTEVRISGEPNGLTGGAPWRVGLQAAGPRATERTAEVAFGTLFRLSLQRALWGKILPSISAIAVGWGAGVGRARFVFDDSPGEDELEHVAVVETEVLADLGERDVVEFTTEFNLDGDVTLGPGETWWAYVRHEPRRTADGQ